MLYKWYGNNGKYKHVNASKCSGGVGIFGKNSLFDTFSIAIEDSTDGIFVLSFINKISKFSFVVFACYLPPENSVWGCNADNCFSHLITQLYLCCDFDRIFLCGDFNARIGNLNDNIPDVDSLSDRISIDITRSGHCDMFLEFLKDSKLCVINGRVTPERDNYTCVSGRGKSVVDYIITPHDCLGECSECEVELTNDLLEKYDCMSLLSSTCKAPDHSLLTVKFSCNMLNSLNNDENLSNTQTQK